MSKAVDWEDEEQQCLERDYKKLNSIYRLKGTCQRFINEYFNPEPTWLSDKEINNLLNHIRRIEKKIQKGR